MTVCALGVLGNSVGKLRATSRPANATPTISVCAHAICPTPCLCHAEIGLCNPCFRINRTLRPPTTPRSTLFRRLARTHLSSDAVKRFAFASVQPEFHAPHACAMTFTTRAITGVMYQTVRFPPTLTMQLFFRLSVTGKSRGPDVPARGWFPSHDRNFSSTKGSIMSALLGKLWRDEEGQDIAEYAVMLAVILVIVVGTVRLVGSNANNVFSNVASSIQ